MEIVLVQIYFLLHVLCTSALSESKKKWDNSTLKKAQVLWRGGLHTFEEKNKFKGLPYHFPENFAELTKKGKQDTFKMGLQLRQIYGHLYNYSYDPYTIRMWIGKSNHSIESSQMVAAGLFPPKQEFEIWSKKIIWQPIPAHHEQLISRAGTFILVVVPICKSQNYITQTSEMEQFADNNLDLMQFLCSNAKCTPKSGEKAQLVFETFKVASCILIELSYPKFLPDWIANDSNRLNQTEQFYFDFHRFLSSFESIQRLSAGWLLGNIIEEFKNGTYSFVTYSAHDDILSPLAAILDEIPSRWPQYGSLLSFQLHEISGTSEVQVWYWYSLDDEPHYLKIKDCEEPCTLASFQKLSSWDPGANYQTECDGSEAASTVFPASRSSSSGVWIALSAILFLLCILFAVCWLSERRKRKETTDVVKLVNSARNSYYDS